MKQNFFSSNMLAGFLLILFALILFSSFAKLQNSSTMAAKKIIQTDKAPKPIGPYSQAIVVNNMLYASGQVAIDPETNQTVTTDIETETRRVMQNVGAILEAGGINYSHIIKTTIFLTDMNDFAKVNEVYGSFFSADFPARETVQVSRLPKDVHVEISVVASME